MSHNWTEALIDKGIGCCSSGPTRVGDENPGFHLGLIFVSDSGVSSISWVEFIRGTNLAKGNHREKGKGEWDGQNLLIWALLAPESLTWAPVPISRPLWGPTPSIAYWQGEEKSPKQVVDRQEAELEDAGPDNTGSALVEHAQPW
jgi:hypothetical protein